MCAQNRSSFWWGVVLLLLVLFFSARTAWGQETAEQGQPPSTPLQEPLPLSASRTSSEAWTDLMQAWSEFGPIWDALVTELDRSQIGISELPTYLESTRGQLASLTTSLSAETQARLAAERSRNLWRAGAIAAGAAFILSLIF